MVSRLVFARALINLLYFVFIVCNRLFILRLTVYLVQNGQVRREMDFNGWGKNGLQRKKKKNEIIYYTITIKTEND